VRVDFLGTGSGNFRGTRRHTSSTLLDTLLLDCGAGATGRLHDAQRFDEVEAVLITHLHSDHVAGLFDFLLHTIIAGRTRPLVVVSPPGLGAILGAAFAAHSTVKNPAELYPFRLIEDRSVDLVVGRWRVQTVEMDHTVTDLGYLLTADGVTAFYSGDTREPSPARKLRADYLIHEGTYSDSHASLARDYGHSTGSQAAETAVAMGARHLWINHIGDRPGCEHEIESEARRIFPDSMVVEDRAVIEL
jgi:ribonuclease Z